MNSHRHVLGGEDSDSLDQAEKTKIQLYIDTLDRALNGQFSTFLGNHSLIDPELKAIMETIDTAHVTESNRYLVKSSAQASVDLIKGGANENKKQKQKAKNVQFKSRVTTSTTDAKGIDVNIKADGGKKT